MGVDPPRKVEKVHQITKFVQLNCVFSRLLFSGLAFRKLGASKGSFPD